MFEAWDQELHFVARIKVPGRLRAGLHLQAKEPKAMKRVLARRALAGIRLFQDNRHVAFKNYQSKLSLPSNTTDPVELMLHGTIKLSNKKIKMKLEITDNAEAITLELLKGTRPPEGFSEGKVIKGTAKKALSRGSEVYWFHAEKK
jgi:hypothetical protein